MQPAQAEFTSNDQDSAGPFPLIEELKAEAKLCGLWNLFPPDSRYGARSPNSYAPLAELSGRSPIAPELINCNAPDIGNREVLLYLVHQATGTLVKSVAGPTDQIGIAMTELNVASRDATNIATRIERDGDHTW